jgi:hypothetical protein
VKPVIIIGAPRSGTNILRDVLTSLPSITTWPCDEINLMWRHGNARHPSDELPPELATPAVQRYMRRQFERVSHRRGCEMVVEKTCANSLRVDFVERIFPDAAYLFIVRDGIDAIASSMKRWTAPFDLAYTLRKVRYVPVTDLPYYGARFLLNRLHRLTTTAKQLAVWGPVFKGMRKAAAELSLEEVCAQQWRACVESAESSLATLPPQRVFRLRYEDFARGAEATTTEICSFLDLPVDTDLIAAAAGKVRDNSVGKGRRALTAQQLRRIERRLAD